MQIHLITYHLQQYSHLRAMTHLYSTNATNASLKNRFKSLKIPYTFSLQYRNVSLRESHEM